MLARSKTATGRLEAATTAFEEANRQISELSAKRNAALLRDADTEAVELGAQIENLQRLAYGHRDKIKLLQEAAAEEERARKVKEKANLIGRIEKLLAKRDAAAGELAAAIKQADAAFRKMVDCGQAAIAAWPWQSHDTHAALFTPSSVVTATTHEIYKTGARPRHYGGTDKPGDGIDFPGGVCPDLRLRNLQEQIKPLTGVCAAASALASSIMRTGRSTSYVEPTAAFAAVPTNGQSESPQRSEAEQRLGGLLRRQAELAENPSAEAEYQAVVAAIAQAQTELDAARKVEQQHG